MAFKIAGLMMLVVVGASATRTKDRMVEMKDTVRDMVKNQMKQLNPDNGMTEEELKKNVDKELRHHDIYQSNAVQNLDDKTYNIVMDALKNLPAASSMLETGDEDTTEVTTEVDMSDTFTTDVDDNTGHPISSQDHSKPEPEEAVRLHNLRVRKIEEEDETDSEQEGELQREHLQQDFNMDDVPDANYKGEAEEGSAAWGVDGYVAEEMRDAPDAEESN